MPAPRHVRLTLSGTLPSQEIFSVNLSLRPEGNEFLTVAAGGLAAAAGALVQETALHEDIRDDCLVFWMNAASGIHSGARLKRVKFAAIKEDGTYAAEPLEFAVDQPGTAVGAAFPHQIARKVTLETAGDLGRVKGGFWLPGVTNNGFDPTTNLTSVQVTEDVQLQVQALIQDIENSPGLDWTGYRVVVPSGGRHNKNGTVRVAPALHDVTAVSVGRRVDVQRRRANKIGEARLAVAGV